MNLETEPRPHELTEVSLTQFVGYFLWLGTVGFGGPIALAGHMQQDLVNERGWISKHDYLDGLALAQLGPGPLAAQLAIYLGYVRAGVVGTTAVALAFVLPSFLMVLALSAAYVRFGGLAWMQGMFYGIGAAVIGIIARSAFKLTKITLGKDRMLWAIFGVLAVSTAWTSREIIWVFLLGGVVAMLVKSFPVRARVGSAAGLFLTTAVLPANSRLWEIFLYFAKAGMFVLGSGLAIVPFLYGGVVQGHHWLTDRQFLDVVVLAPSYKRWAKNPQLNAFVRGVTAAAAGAIAGAVVVLARRSIYDLPTVVIAVVSLAVLFRWKVPEPVIIAVAAVAGLLLHHA